MTQKIAQVVLFLGCLAAIVLTYRFANPELALVAGLASTVIHALLPSLIGSSGSDSGSGSGDSGSPSPGPSAALKAVAGGAAALMFVASTSTACSLFSSAAAQVQSADSVIQGCEQAGREAPDGGHIAAYDDCMKEAGLH